MSLRSWWEKVLNVSVRMKILGIALGMLILLSLGVVGYVRFVFRQTLLSEMRARGSSLTQHLATSSMDYLLTNDLFQLHQLARETLEHFEDVRYVFMTGSDGQVLAHTFGRLFPADLLQIEPVPPGASEHVQPLASEEGMLWDIAVPVLDGRVGTVHVGFSEERVRTRIQAVTRYLLTVTAAIAILGTLTAYVLTAVITRPIRELDELARQVAARNFNTRAKAHFQDEVGHLALTFNDMIRSLAASETKIEEYNRKLLERDRTRKLLLHRILIAQEQERTRIARELHDEPSQQLAALTMVLGVVEQTAHQDQKLDYEHIYAAQRIAEDVLNEIRRIIQNLRPARLEDMGLVAAVRWWIERQAGLDSPRFRLEFPKNLELPQLSTEHVKGWEAEVHLFRIIQEAATNILRHAQARNARIALSFDSHQLVLRIRDDGVGFELGSENIMVDETHHFGLRGIAERAELLDGHVEITSAPGEGTQVVVTIPVAGESEVS